MFLRRNTYLFILLSVLVPGCSFSARYGPPPEQSAGFVAWMTATVGGATSTSRVMAAGGKFRMEVQGGRRSSVMIVRYDLESLWVLIPAAAQYKEFPLESMGHQLPHFFMPDLAIERERIGEERVGSVSAVKYRASIKNCGRTYEGLLWEAKDLPGYPLKWYDPTQRTTVVWKNARLEKIPDTLFRIPAGYTELPQSSKQISGRQNQCRKMSSEANPDG